MARIIEKSLGSRRTILLNVNDIISTVREYQRIVKPAHDYDEIRKLLQNSKIFIPEDA